MAKEWTDEEVKNEIAEAVRIVREDRFETFVRGRLSSNDQQSDDKNPNPPGPNGNPDSSKKKGSLWWGESE